MAKSVGGLGKGLGALLNDGGVNVSRVVAGNAGKTAENASSGLPAAPSGDFLLEVDRLVPNPHQPRTEFDEEALNELASSIKEHGVIQPVLVEEGENGKYYIIAGERRTRAAKLAGLTKIPVRIQKFSDEKKLEVALIENIQRENLNPLEEALAYKKLMEMTGVTQDEVARRVGKNRSTVANALRLLKLPEDMQNALSSGEISAGHARALLSVSDSTDMRMLFGRIIGQNLSVREAERQALELNGNASEPSKAAGTKGNTSKTDSKAAEKRDPNLVHLEERLIEVLGTKVAIKGDLEKGTVQIEYYNKDDLDRVFSLIAKD